MVYVMINKYYVSVAIYIFFFFYLNWECWYTTTFVYETLWQYNQNINTTLKTWTLLFEDFACLVCLL